MLKFSIFLGSTLCSVAVGYAADQLGADFFWSFVISGVGAIFGCWLGWWVYRRYLS